MSQQVELFQSLVKEIERLDELSRKVVSMYYVDQFSAQEMASILEIDEMEVAKIFEKAVDLIVGRLEAQNKEQNPETKAVGE